jgi:hypothetical protein
MTDAKEKIITDVKKEIGALKEELKRLDEIIQRGDWDKLQRKNTQ